MENALPGTEGRCESQVAPCECDGRLWKLQETELFACQDRTDCSLAWVFLLQKIDDYFKVIT